MDAYSHLDMSQPNPLADLAERLQEANLDRALVVETWDGANRRLLEDMTEDGRFHVSLCWRGERSLPTNIAAVRVRTSALAECEDLLEPMQSRSQCLLVHGDTPIEDWAPELIRIAASRQSPRVYVPHLAWPRFDRSWADSMQALSLHENVHIGVSAIAHFSTEPFPHDDVHSLAEAAINYFGPARVHAGSDYPLIGKEQYGSYMRLAQRWITQIWPNWSNDDALFA